MVFIRLTRWVKKFDFVKGSRRQLPMHPISQPVLTQATRFARTG